MLTFLLSEHPEPEVRAGHIKFLIEWLVFFVRFFIIAAIRVNRVVLFLNFNTPNPPIPSNCDVRCCGSFTVNMVPRSVDLIMNHLKKIGFSAFNAAVMGG